MLVYDAIVILGSQPDPRNWQFPSHVFKTLDRAIDGFVHEASPAIVVSGKWAIRFDILHIAQPFRECDKMADYLIERGIPEGAIFKEGDSKDTISNLYYLKKNVLGPHKFRNLLVITADFRKARIEFLCQKILGDTYHVTFETVEPDPNEAYAHESDTLIQQQKFLASMRDGDDRYLDGRFFGDPYYDAVSDRLVHRDASEQLFS